MPDTNILWNDEAQATFVSPSFVDDWQRLYQLSQGRLLIPHVVYGELLYQKFRTALASLRNAAGEVRSFKRIAELEANISRPSDAELRQALERRLTAEYQSLSNSRIVATPYARFTPEVMSRMVDCAIWRNPPFKTTEKEEGFRDALILETVEHIVEHNSHSDVGFITNDTVLRAAAEIRLKERHNFACYSSMRDFQAFVNAALTEISSVKLHGIIQNAHGAFFTTGDQQSFWYSAAIEQKIRDAIGFNTYIDAAGGATYSLSIVPSAVVPAVWTASAPPLLQPIGTSFVSIVGRNEYHWRSTIQGTGSYYAAPALLSPSAGKWPERFRHLLIDVYWQCEVLEPNRYAAFSVSKIETVYDSLTESPTADANATLIAAMVRSKRRLSS